MAAQLIELGDGFSVYATAKEEAEFIFKEIFKDRCYDVALLPENPFIIDVGANIGISIIYMKKKYPSARIIGFEPAPVNYATMLRNLKRHKISDVETHQCALGAEDATRTLTFYPMLPGNSTFAPEEKEIVKSLPAEPMVQDVLGKMFSVNEKIDVPVKRLSSFLGPFDTIREIDLLKIDVEGHEIDVCRGLSDDEWTLVRNVAVEIFDVNGALDKTVSYLESKGLSVTVETVAKGQDDPGKPKICMLYGHRGR